MQEQGRSNLRMHGVFTRGGSPHDGPARVECDEHHGADDEHAGQHRRHNGDRGRHFGAARRDLPGVVRQAADVDVSKHACARQQRGFRVPACWWLLGAQGALLQEVACRPLADSQLGVSWGVQAPGMMPTADVQT